jgi:hypothetical protein
MAITAILPNQVLAAGASDGDLLTVQADGSVAFETPAGGGGIGGSTGATDNAVLRADGTGGSTLQSSGVTIDDGGSITSGQHVYWGSSANYAQNNTGTGFGLTFGGFGQKLKFTGSWSLSPRYSSSTLAVGHDAAKIKFGTTNWTDDDTNRLVASTLDGTHFRNTTATSSTFIAIANTDTSATSYERLEIGWSANVATINTTAGSAGGTKRGLQICSAATDELGFFGATPVDQPATVADPSGGGTVDTEARAAIASLIDRLQELGLIA